jgi:hypothetical protein
MGPPRSKGLTFSLFFTWRAVSWWCLRDLAEFFRDPKFCLMDSLLD